MNHIKFLKQLIKDPKSTGAIAPSSEDLADLITDTANLQNSMMIVELGSGTGIFTRKILEKKSSSADFFALEISSDFVKISRETGAIIYHDCAMKIDHYLKLHEKEYCDTVISGLPFAAFDKSLQRGIMNSVIESLNPGGQFLTFAYLQGMLMPQGRRFRNLLDEEFREVRRTEIVWNNLPPAFVYHCIK